MEYSARALLNKSGHAHDAEFHKIVDHSKTSLINVIPNQIAIDYKYIDIMIKLYKFY